jgi:hypothetical protein
MKLLIAILTCHRLDYYFDDNTIDWLTQRGYHTLDQQARVNAQRETWLSPKSMCDISVAVDKAVAQPESSTVDYKFFYGTRLRDTVSKPNQRVATPQPRYLREPLADEVFLPCEDQYTYNAIKMRAICKYALDNGYDYVLRVDDDTLAFPELFQTDWHRWIYSGAATSDFHPGSCVFLRHDAMKAIVAARVTHYADDVWVGQVLASHGIPGHTIPGIRHEFGDKYLAKSWNGEVSLHSVTPELMRSIWDQRTTSLSQQQKDMAGVASRITPSPSPSLDSEDEKSSSSAISLTSPETHSLDSDLNLSTTPRQEITPSLSGFESSETGLQQTNTASDSSSIVTYATL